MAWPFSPIQYTPRMKRAFTSPLMHVILLYILMLLHVPGSRMVPRREVSADPDDEKKTTNRFGVQIFGGFGA